MSYIYGRPGKDMMTPCYVNTVSPARFANLAGEAGVTQQGVPWHDADGVLGKLKQCHGMHDVSQLWT